MNDNKSVIQKNIDSCREELVNLSHYIHENPELGLKEYKASDAICTLLAKHGFEVQRNIAGMETAFKAQVKGKTDGPHVVICAEYDALANVDHGCGHNVIAASSVGAFLGISSVINELGGRVTLLGTPAEESDGGKIIMLKQGIFDDVDFAMMMHPTAGKSVVARTSRTTGRVYVTFIGKPAHSSKPEKGINALNAAVSFYNGINAMRSQFINGDNANMIITEGGKAMNIIPDRAVVKLHLRTEKYSRLVELIKIAKAIAESSAQMIGAKCEITIAKLCYERYPNMPLSDAFKANLESLGEKVEYSDNTKYYGSSDMNDVSIHVPMIHDYIAISDEDFAGHTLEFRDAAVSSRADDVCILGAKTLAMTAFDILNDEKLREKALIYQKKTVPEEYLDKSKQYNEV